LNCCTGWGRGGTGICNSRKERGRGRRARRHETGGTGGWSVMVTSNFKCTQFSISKATVVLRQSEISPKIRSFTQRARGGRKYTVTTKKLPAADRLTRILRVWNLQANTTREAVAVVPYELALGSGDVFMMKNAILSVISDDFGG